MIVRTSRAAITQLASSTDMVPHMSVSAAVEITVEVTVKTNHVFQLPVCTVAIVTSNLMGTESAFA